MYTLAFSIGVVLGALANFNVDLLMIVLLTILALFFYYASKNQLSKGFLVLFGAIIGSVPTNLYFAVFAFIVTLVAVFLDYYLEVPWQK